MQLSEQEIIRREKLDRLRELGINPYPANLFPVDHTSKQVKDNFSEGKKVVNRQYNQHQRIKHGVYNGSLTPREAGALRMQQAKVRHYKQMAMADGRITPAERNLINRTQKQANRNIYHQKHDRQVRCR